MTHWWEPVEVTPAKVKAPTWFGKIFSDVTQGAGIRAGPDPGMQWDVQGVSVRFATSAAAANRYCHLAIEGAGFKSAGANTAFIWQCGCTNTFTASGVSYLNWAIGAGDSTTPNITPGNAFVETHPLPVLVFRDNMGFFFIIDNADAGDNWTMNIYGYQYPLVK